MMSTADDLTFSEAREIMANYFIKIDKVTKKLPNDIPNHEETPDSIKVLRNRRKMLRSKKEKFGRYLLTIPRFREAMVSHRFDVTGSRGAATEEDFREAFSGNKEFEDALDDFLDEQGELFHSVKDFLNEHNWHITERGGSPAGEWHLGVPVQWNEATDLSDAFYCEYKSLIDGHRLQTRIVDWGPNLPTIKSSDDAYDYLGESNNDADDN